MAAPPPPAGTEDSTWTQLTRTVRRQGKLLGGSIAVLWIVNLLDTIVGHRLAIFGIHPRSIDGLLGILAAPFLHGSWAHLFSNSLAILMFGAIVMMQKTRRFFEVAALAALIGGLGTWLIGASNSVHIGASGVVFGLLGYLLSRGIFDRKLWPIVGSVAALLMFGGTLRGLLPGVPGISWEGHLFGFLGGVLAARIAARGLPSLKKKPVPSTAARARVAPVPAARQRIAADTPVAPDTNDDVDAELEALRRRAGR